MDMLKRALALALLCAVTLAPIPALAQAENPTVDVNCNYVNDPDLAWRESICTAWAPCNMVNKIGRACAKTKQFLKNVGDVFTLKAKEVDPTYKSSMDSPPSPTLWEKIKAKLSTDDVAQAALPETNNRAFKANDAATDRLMADYQAAKAHSEGKLLPSGSYYEGAMKNGEPDGPGTRIRANGLIERGQFRNGELNGQGEYIYPKGDVLAGRMGGGTIVAGASVTPEGNIRAGVFSNGYPVGKVEVEYANGTSQVVYNDKTAKTIAEGPMAKPGEEPVEPPTPPGFPPEPKEDYPLWSPSAPTGSIIEYSMLWGRDDDKSALSLAKNDPTTKDVIGSMQFCRPIMGSLSPEEKEACGIKDPPPQPQQQQHQPQQNTQNNSSDDDHDTPAPALSNTPRGGIGGSINGPAFGSLLGGMGLMATTARPLTQEEIRARRNGQPLPPRPVTRLNGIDCNPGSAGCNTRQASLPPPAPPQPVNVGARPSYEQAQAMVAQLQPQCGAQMAAASAHLGGQYNALRYAAGDLANMPINDWYAVQDRIKGVYQTVANLNARPDPDSAKDFAFSACILEARLRQMGPAPARADQNSIIAGLRQTCAVEVANEENWERSGHPPFVPNFIPGTAANNDVISLRGTMKHGMEFANDPTLPYWYKQMACIARARLAQLGTQ